MNTEQSVLRDERTIAVENASYKWAYLILVWPLIIDALYRQKELNEEVGDLIALICLSGVIGIAYQVRHRALVSHWPWRRRKSLIVFAACIAVAILAVFFALTV